MAEPLCPGCRQRDRRIAELEGRVADLEATVRDLLARLGQNSSNSSLPPSANPLNAPPPVVKQPTGRKRGGQPGHPGHTRTLLPPDQVRQTINFVPTTCQRCQAPLPVTAGPQDPEPLRHQLIDLPPVTAYAIEYQAHGRTCPCCGVVTWEKIPDALRAQGFGPTFTATVGYLSAVPHLSKRGIQEVCAAVFRAPLALGSVTNIEQEVSAALAPAHAEALAVVRAAPIKHADETGWEDHGWLWAAATATVVCFVIHPKRGLTGLLALLGKKIKGILCSDRWAVYARWVAQRRQVCWAHLKRDFQKVVDRGGSGKELGEAGLACVHLLFHWWHAYRGGGLSRRQLQHELEPIRVELTAWLQQGCASSDSKLANFCTNLLKLEPALWTFLYKEGVEPTNNHMERLLRTGVLWRKMSFGCDSEGGCRFVERSLTVVQTLRLQKRPVLDFLREAVLAYRLGQPAPQLVETG